MAAPSAFRVLDRFVADRPFGVISAYRSNLPERQNQARHSQLMADLHAAGYCPRPFASQWKGVPEKSLFVPDVDFRTLRELGEKYEQDAVVFKDQSGSIGLYSNDP